MIFNATVQRRTPSEQGGKPHAGGRFGTTQWSLVVAAQDEASPRAEEALARLCYLYWYPLYAFIRRQGYSADEAQDLTQGFFARFLEKGYLRDVHREKGRFRSFLLVACKHFVAKERDCARALKRGGGQELVPIDREAAEGRYRREPSHDLTPDRLYQRQWALTLLDQVRLRLRAELVASGRADRFDRLKVFLTGDEGSEAYAAAGRDLGLSEGAVKVAVHRLRRRYRKLLRESIAETVNGPAEVDGEIRQLMEALSL